MCKAPFNVLERCSIKITLITCTWLKNNVLEINKSIVKKIKKNNRKVTLDLYHYSFNLLMSIAVRYHKNEEEQMEIVNTSFMKIVVSIDQFKIGSSYFSWAKKITQNVVIDEFRKTKNYKVLFKLTENDQYLESETNNSFQESSFDINIDAFAAEEIELILSQLPPASKITFNLFAIEGYSYKEIAEELDIGYETVKWHIKESRKKLQSILKYNTLEIE